MRSARTRRAHQPGLRRALGAAGLLVSLVPLVAACEREARPTGGFVLPSPAATDVSPRTAAPVLTSAIVAGEARPAPPAPNPYVENAYVVAEGKRLFQWMNCAGCHGLDGGGGMGPPFADGRWIYGSAPATIYQSIVQGRPEGMPAFPALADDQVWKLVAYVRSLAPDRGDATP
jgi:cytochrome c oxidase cbb3-type subunit 3